ncbi:MAG: protein kinase [Proteobacteria bacterium]|nr:protein kinase [Pseudomonadota bacterium]
MSPGKPQNSLVDGPLPARLARLFASPLGVMIILPALVVGVGLVVLVLGRSVTRDASDSMARSELVANARDIEHEIAFALDQTQPMLDALRPIATPDLPLAEVAPRMRDLQAGRPGVTNVSIGFPSGVMRGTYRDRATNEIRVQETRAGVDRVDYRVAGRTVTAITTAASTYDVRQRPHYAQALATPGPSWMAPRVYFTSKTTGITATEAVRVDGAVVAVITIDFDVGALSEFIAKAPFAEARSIVFAGDGTILAAPGLPVPEAAAKEGRLLRTADYQDAAITALFAALSTELPDLATHPMTAQRFVDTGSYLASIAPIGGARAGIAAPLDWYHATLVPRDVLLAPTHRFERQMLVASAIALAIALGVAVMFAWNVVRMRRAVTTARAELRTAEARARELGSYRLVGKLGAGGMGEVWRAEHRLLARAAAIKLVRPEALRDEAHAAKLRERFRREAQTLATMRSRNTIALYDYGVTDDGTFYFVMELLDGLDLDKLVKEFGRQPAARVIDILIQACNSLAEAHDAGLLHRDIKPANIFVSRAADEVDVVKVLDFGIVQYLVEPVDPLEAIVLPAPDTLTPASSDAVSGKLTALGSVVGTPGYIPPEMGAGGAVDTRGDLYALGCVAWWLLTATEVFPRGRDGFATIQRHMFEEVPELASRVAGWLPPALEEIVRACLAKRPADRPANARLLAAQLRAIEIPAEHAFRGDRATAWWLAYRPPAVATAETPTLVADQVNQEDVPTATGRLVVPDAADAPAMPDDPDAAASASQSQSAATVVNGRSRS